MGIVNLLTSLFKHSSPKKKPQVTDEQKKAFNKKYDDLGLFTYTLQGFTYRSTSGELTYNWTDIEKLVVYKIDLLTIDEIRMDVYVGSAMLTITEETPGWYQFVAKTKAMFPAIPQSWDFEIILPPFAANVRIIYENPHEGLRRS